MNIDNVPYDHFIPEDVSVALAQHRLNHDLVRERSQIALSHIISELKSLDATCQIRRKRML